MGGPRRIPHLSVATQAPARPDPYPTTSASHLSFTHNPTTSARRRQRRAYSCTTSVPFISPCPAPQNTVQWNSNSPALSGVNSMVCG